MNDEDYFLECLINLRDEITCDNSNPVFGDWDREVACIRSSVFEEE